MLLQEFNFTIEHCPGIFNNLPDLLSRQPDEADVSSTNAASMDVQRLLPPVTEELYVIPEETLP